MSFFGGGFVWRGLTEKGQLKGRIVTTACFHVGRVRQFSVILAVFEYPKGVRVPLHRDTDYGAANYLPIFCLNIIVFLRNAVRGGEFRCENPWWRSRRIIIFDGARCQHEVTEVEEGKRVSLFFLVSFGKFVDEMGYATASG